MCLLKWNAYSVSTITLPVLFSIVSSRGGIIACGLVDCSVHRTTLGGAIHIESQCVSSTWHPQEARTHKIINIFEMNE